MKALVAMFKTLAWCVLFAIVLQVGLVFAVAITLAVVLYVGFVEAVFLFDSKGGGGAP